MSFSFIPPGRFLMGSNDPESSNSERPVHAVTLTQGFFLGIHAVTQAQWRTLMVTNPSHHQGDEFPVEKVSWDDCQEFVGKLSEFTGDRYRLPTEAEWEYACRAGTATPFWSGETITTDQVNYYSGSRSGKGRQGLNRDTTTPVGTFPPNAWGLFDMHGNVWEWCVDWDGAYPDGEAVDPVGPATGIYRVLRGGSFYNTGLNVRSAQRFNYGPASRYSINGFRVARML
jgi:formylglycine-generating enzyme required for sulfatase activity